MGETEFIIEPDRHDVTVRRVFDAPPERVFQALTDPQLVPRYWGPRRFETMIEEMDVRPGGRWRFIHHDPERGDRFTFGGVFHTVEPPERIVQTFEFDGVPGHVSLDTAILEPMNGGTKYTAHTVFQSVEDRDAAMRSGMEDGMRELMDRLAEVVENR